MQPYPRIACAKLAKDNSEKFDIMNEVKQSDRERF